MGTCKECFSILNVYWKYTRKWFLGIVVGMAALELGLLLYYVNGGFRYMYIIENDDKHWSMEYAGALKSIRLEYIIPVFAVAFMVFLTLSYFSVSGKNSSILLQRLPISTKMQNLMQITHSLIMLLSFWLVQFLIIIIGFFLYRYSAPDGLQIDLQIFKAFWGPGFLYKLYPFLNLGYIFTWMLCLINLSILPSCIVHRSRMKDGPEPSWVAGILLIILITLLLFSQFGEEMKTVYNMVFLFMLALAMIWSMFFREVHLHMGAHNK